MTYPLLRRREESLFISAAFTYQALNDRVFGASIANRTMVFGTLAVNNETVGAIADLPLVTSAMFSFSPGNVTLPDPVQEAANIAGVNTAGTFAKLNFTLNATVAFTEKLSLSTNVTAQGQS